MARLGSTGQPYDEPRSEPQREANRAAQAYRIASERYRHDAPAAAVRRLQLLGAVRAARDEGSRLRRAAQVVRCQAGGGADTRARRTGMPGRRPADGLRGAEWTR